MFYVKCYQYDRFAYSETANITRSNVLSILYLAKKYLLDELSTACVGFLGKNLTADDVCTVINQSVVYDEENLTKKCVNYIGLRFDEVAHTDTFVDLSRAALAAVIKYDYLVVENELVLYRTLLRWAKNQFRRSSNSDAEPGADDVRRVLGDLVYRVRFLNVEPNKLVEEFKNDLQILSASEQAELLRCRLPASAHNQISDKPPVFDTGSRAQICSRFKSTDLATEAPSRAYDYQPLCIQVDKDVEVIGFFLFGVTPDIAPVHLDFDVHIGGYEFTDTAIHGWDDATPAVVGFDCDGRADPYPVLLPHPVVVHTNRDPNEWRMFEFEMKDPEKSSRRSIQKDT